MKYCLECGTKLTEKFLANEGTIPYCPSCDAFRFPVFNTAVSMIVLNQTQDKILLIKQYQRDDFILVAGFVNKGENGEHAVAREMKEELGLSLSSLHYNKSAYYDTSNTLILNFTCVAVDESLAGMTEEVDYAEWFSFAEARLRIKAGSLAQMFLESYLQHLEAR